MNSDYLYLDPIGDRLAPRFDLYKVNFDRGEYQYWTDELENAIRDALVGLPDYLFAYIVAVVHEYELSPGESRTRLIDNLINTQEPWVIGHAAHDGAVLFVPSLSQLLRGLETWPDNQAQIDACRWIAMHVGRVELGRLLRRATVVAKRADASQGRALTDDGRVALFNLLPIPMRGLVPLVEYCAPPQVVAIWEQVHAIQVSDPGDDWWDQLVESTRG